ncbi:GspH/FimT family pseudopilin [Halopseudomonas salegens]|uniref:Type II secretion system protein H n=1 Tax=Halopseudomonas salegens TaxID=1434072 RepID=A0A1H2EBB3_9GAMM|nr:GspH/FimT family protein [Halopseudomonas salegens]SDT92432.1 type IV fimbrial biogenesis protein FimT [Halopseudomonas salegens]
MIFFHRKGFTLIELVVALAVVAVLLVLALPAFGNLIDRTRMDADASELLRTLRFARQEAVRGNQTLTVAPLTAQDWNRGWVVFVDRNHNGELDKNEPLLRAYEGSGNSAIKANTPLSRYVRYNALGQSQLLNGGFQAGTFRFCPQDLTRPGVKMVINRVGRVRVERGVIGWEYCEG